MNDNLFINNLKQMGIINPDNSLHVRFKRTLMTMPEVIQQINNRTSFLTGETVDLKIRLHVILQGITEQPKCEACGCDVHMRVSGVYRYTFPRYCSSKCSSSADDVQRKRKETNLQRYGHENPNHNPDVRAKAVATIVDRYGVDNPAKSKEIRDKAKSTCMERYGAESAMLSPDVRKKQIETNLQRYGVENVGAHPDTIKKREQTTLDRYGVDNPFKSAEFQLKRFETMVSRYGVSYALQCPESRVRFRSTMVDRHGAEHALRSDHLLKKQQHTMLDRYGVENMFQLESVRSKGVETRIRKYGTPHFNQSRYTNSNRGGSSSSATAQRDVVDHIRMAYSGPIVTNDRTTISPYELDIYLPDLRIAIEFNGIVWHGEGMGRGPSYHLHKTQSCEEKGIHLVQVLDSEWELNQDLVLSRITSKMGLNRRIYARQCDIEPISSDVSSNFFNTYHIQHSVPAKWSYGLYHNGELVAAMSFGKPRFDRSFEFELLRYASAFDINIVGGASKLFKRFVSDLSPSTIITYSDRRWNTGGLYEQLNFKFDRNTPPNYYYFKPSQSNVLYHRATFQKHKLEEKLETFDPTLSEWKNMQNNGYDRIWDCGHKRYVWSTSDGM